MVHLLLPLYLLRLSHFVSARHVHHSCSQCTSTSLFIEFSDDTVILGLIKDNVASYRNPVSQLAAWCTENSLELSTRWCRWS